MAAFTIHEAKTNLSKLIARVEAGEEVVIMRGKDPVARLEPIAKMKGQRVPGLLKDKIPDLPDEFFFAPMSEEESKHWDSGDEGPR